MRRRAARRGSDRRDEFAPDHPEIAGRSLVLPVSTRGGGAPQAWLLAALDSGGLGDFERLILQQAVTVVALELMRQRAMRDTERRLAGDVLAEALTGRLSQEELRMRLRPFGVGADAAVLVFSSDDGGRRARRGRARPVPRGGRRARAGGPPRAAPLRRGRRRARASTRWRWPSRPATRSTAGRGTAASRRVAAGAGGRAPQQLPRGALRARGRRRCANGHSRRVASYRDLGAFQLMLSLQDDEALRLYCDSVLGPLEDASGEYGDELIRSLETYIEQNGQWERAARELLLPQAYAALPDPTGGAAHRPRPVEGAATGSSSGWR